MISVEIERVSSENLGELRAKAFDQLAELFGMSPADVERLYDVHFEVRRQTGRWVAGVTASGPRP